MENLSFDLNRKKIIKLRVPRKVQLWELPNSNEVNDTLLNNLSVKEKNQK